MAESPTITVSNRVPRSDLTLGLVRAEGVIMQDATEALQEALDLLISERRDGLDGPTEARRKASRDMLRNGKYKPTGRGKPANEYLLRAAGAEFPRINGPVDANNIVSLRYMVPISIWDLGRCESAEFEFRLGAEGEQYVFNGAGQVLGLQDLVCGCGVVGSDSKPLVTPIKDSLATKLQSDTTRIAGVIYFPVAAGIEHLEPAVHELAQWLSACGPAVSTTIAIARGSETQTF